MTQMYARTNENLKSIVAGLDVQPKDYILAVGGSGDQAFALIERARRVLAVDTEAYQVNHMRRMAELIKEGDYRGFLYARTGGSDPHLFLNEPDLSDIVRWEMHHGSKYFTLEKFERIRKNLGNLQFRQGEIVETTQTEDGFNKVYLSNALGKDHITGENAREALIKISKRLPVDGLVYVSDHVAIFDYLDGCGLEREELLTARTSDKGWCPIVLRKSSSAKVQDGSSNLLLHSFT